jgi:hypothetical protein
MQACYSRNYLALGLQTHVLRKGLRDNGGRFTPDIDAIDRSIGVLSDVLGLPAWPKF